ncbi:MAG: hypothetical protein U0W24_11180 [Bacteroidales bacterium]
MYKALYLSPMIPSFNLEETSRFFIEILDFSMVMNAGNYVICQKDNLTIHILKAGADVGQMEFYLEVDQIDTLWEQIKTKVKGLKVREPFNQDYGMREIHIGIPETNTLLFIGKELQGH